MATASSSRDLEWAFDHPQARTIVLACSMAALFEIPMYVYLFANLSLRWGVSASGRALAAAGLEFAGVAVGAAAILGVARRVRLTPSYASRAVAASTIAGGAVVVATGMVTTLGPYAALLLLALVLLAPSIPLLLASSLSMLPPQRARFWGSGETALLLGAAGLGTGLAAAVAHAFGLQAALVVLATAPAAAGVVVLRATRARA